jgi:hypothetical protein
LKALKLAYGLMAMEIQPTPNQQAFIRYAVESGRIEQPEDASCHIGFSRAISAPLVAFYEAHFGPSDGFSLGNGLHEAIILAHSLARSPSMAGKRLRTSIAADSSPS